jgi:hypothetical protein
LTPNSTPPPAPSQDRILTTRTQFEATAVLLVAEATQTLWFNAFDFSDWQFDRPQFQLALHAFFQQHPQAQLNLLLGEPQFLASRAPRFGQLRANFAGQIDCRKHQGTPAMLAGSEQFIVADRRHCLRRIAPANYRSRFLMDAPERCERILLEYQHAWDNASPCLPATAIGL